MEKVGWPSLVTAGGARGVQKKIHQQVEPSSHWNVKSCNNIASLLLAHWLFKKKIKKKCATSLKHDLYNTLNLFWTIISS